MSFLHTLGYVVNHPLNRKKPFQAAIDWLRWHLAARLSDQPTVCSFTPKGKILVSRDFSSATGCQFCGLFEFADMAFLLHFLRDSDTFLDVGANVGVYTILASAEVGAQTIAFEPVPSTYAVLEQNVALNNVTGRVRLHNLGLSDAPGKLQFTTKEGAMNHVVQDSSELAISVQVARLDDLYGTSGTTVLKIDVEGFETKVLAGAPLMLASPQLQVIIIELNGFSKRYGFDDMAIHQRLLAAGFSPYSYDAFRRNLTLLTAPSTNENTLYLKNESVVRERVLTASTRTIRGCTF